MSTDTLDKFRSLRTTMRAIIARMQLACEAGMFELLASADQAEVEAQLMSLMTNALPTIDIAIEELEKGSNLPVTFTNAMGGLERELPAWLDKLQQERIIHCGLERAAQGKKRWEDIRNRVAEELARHAIDAMDGRLRLRPALTLVN
jgi:hypothetical protein